MSEFKHLCRKPRLKESMWLAFSRIFLERSEDDLHLGSPILTIWLLARRENYTRSRWGHWSSEYWGHLPMATLLRSGWALRAIQGTQGPSEKYLYWVPLTFPRRLSCLALKALQGTVHTHGCIPLCVCGWQETSYFTDSTPSVRLKVKVYPESNLSEGAGQERQGQPLKYTQVQALSSELQSLWDEVYSHF